MERLLSMKLCDVAGSSFLADPPVRGTDYKKKGNGIEKRAMRLHRRSIDQRKMRDQTLLKQRGIDAMSPLKEVQNVKEKTAQPQKKTAKSKIEPQPQNTDMKDRLKKWKEEKELKKKLQRQKQQKSFKVQHIQYEKIPFAAETKKPATRATRSSAKTNVKPTPSKPTVTATRPATRQARKPSTTGATRSSARTNVKAATVSQPVPSDKPTTRQTRLRQKVQPTAKITSTRTTRTRSGSQASNTEIKPTRSTRSTRTSARAAQKQKDEVKPASTRATRSKSGTRSSKKKEMEEQKEEKPEQKEEPEQREEELAMKTENLFSQGTVNFERGEPCSTSFLQGPSFAPVDFKFDFTMGTIINNENNDSKTPDRRCSSTPLNNTKSALFKLPSPPAGLSTIRPSRVSTSNTTEVPINIPILSLSTSSMSGGQQTNPAMPSDTFVVGTVKASQEAAAPMEVAREETAKSQDSVDDIHQKTPSMTESHPSGMSQKSSVGEEDKALISGVGMETEELLSAKEDSAEAESKESDVEMKEVPATTEDVVTEPITTAPEVEVPSTTEDVVTEAMTTAPEEEMKEITATSEDVITEPMTTAPEEETKAPATTEDVVTEPMITVPEEEMKEVPSAKDNKVAEKPESIEEPKTEAVVAPGCESATSTKHEEEAKQDTGKAEDEEKDVPYFRKLVSSQTDRLTCLCDKWQGVMDSSSLSEDVLGELRSTTGKAQLLMDQRFKQFIGLVDDCEFDRGEKKTHCTDLIGFWEMVAYQVEDVERMFGDLDKLQANNWVKEVKVLKKVKKVKKPKPGAAPKKGAVDRSAARQRLLAAKAALKAKATRSKENDKVVFEGGFFKVESPIRSPRVHCEAGSPLSAAFLRRTNTPGSKPGSRQGTPRAQAFTPSKPRLSLQSALCTPISKLVLTETDDTNSSPAHATRSRQGTPINVVKPLVNTGTSASLSKSQMKDAPSTPLARTPVSKVTVKHRESVRHPLIPGIASPHMTTSSDQVFDAPSIFTPPSKKTLSTSSSSSVNDLICLDSPLAPTLAPPLPLPQASSQETTGYVKCFAAINASSDMKDLLGTDVVMSPVRRSTRIRHTSGQLVVDKLADMPDEVDYGYQPNMSLL